jgi:hypothetical protein
MVLMFALSVDKDSNVLQLPMHLLFASLDSIKAASPPPFAKNVRLVGFKMKLEVPFAILAWQGNSKL